MFGSLKCLCAQASVGSKYQTLNPRTQTLILNGGIGVPSGVPIINTDDSISGFLLSMETTKIGNLTLNSKP